MIASELTRDQRNVLRAVEVMRLHAAIVGYRPDGTATADARARVALLADSHSVGGPFTFTPDVGDLVWLSERKPSLWWIGRLFGLTRPAMAFAVVHSRPVPRPSGRLAIETEDGRWMFAELSALRIASCQLDDLIAYENMKRGEP